MSEDSPVTPGTEFNVTFSFFDLQDDTAIRYLDTLTNTGTNQPVGRMECGGSLVGWGQDVSSTVIRNPIVNRVTIASDCPEGSYRLKSAIQDNSGNEIISGSIDFDIGDPDLTPTAPSVSNFTAKQNSHFSEQLPLGSGGDGTLRYSAVDLPIGITFTDSPPTISGTPTGYGIATVTYTVTDADGDPDSVQFTITVAQDFLPSAPVISDFTGRVGRYFEQQISRGTGDDVPLSFSVTDLPDGLSFYQDTHMITGTPTKQQSPTVTYTVRDGDQDEAGTTFTIEVMSDLMPTLTDRTGQTYLAKVESPFSLQLDAAQNGDPTYIYTVTAQPALPADLVFNRNTLRIEGTPGTDGAVLVTYEVTDVDGDPASTTFTIDVKEDRKPTLTDRTGQTYAAKVGSPFSLQLDAAQNGDPTYIYTVTAQPALPADLVFNRDTLRIEGTPGTDGAVLVTYEVTDVDGDPASTTFTIDVKEDRKPTLTDRTGQTYAARVDSPFSLQLDAAQNGDPTYIYTVTAQTGSKGTPPSADRDLHGSTDGDTLRPLRRSRRELTDAVLVTYEVTDVDGDPASTTFTIDVKEDREADADGQDGSNVRGKSRKVRRPGNRNWMRRKTVASADVHIYGDGSATARRPADLVFNRDTLRIEGTPGTDGAVLVTYEVPG